MDNELELAPSDVTLLFLLAAEPTTADFNDLREWFKNGEARDIGRILVGQAPVEAPTELHMELRSLAETFRSRVTIEERRTGIEVPR
jgi:hypothetical protein